MTTPALDSGTAEGEGQAGPPPAALKEDKGKVPHLPDWWILLAVLLVSSGAAFGVATLYGGANKRLEVAHQLGRFQASVNRESALEWESVATQSVNEGFRDDFQAARQNSSAVLRRVRELEPRNEALARLSVAYGEFRTSVDLEQSFLGRGDTEGAERLDRRRVDPAFRELHALSTRIGAQHSNDAQGAIRLIVWGTSSLVTVTALVVGLLFILYSRRGQRVLRQSERRFRSLVQNSSDVIVLVDANGRTSFVTPAVERVLGYDLDEARELQAFDMIHPEDLARSRTIFSEVASQEGSVATTELRVRHKDGSWRWIETTGTNLLHDPGINAIVANYHDITARKELEAKLTHQAFHDALTKLPNRVLLKDRIEHALLRRTETKRSLAVLFVDLDDFKTVNDTLGHEVGDQFLVAVARRLESCLRASDTLARLGGDEFAILLEDMQHVADAVMIAERVVEAMKEPFDLDGKQVFMKASIGIVTDISPDADTDQLLHNADTAMYVAKATGKGGYEIFEPQMHERVLRRLELKADLNRAIENDEFCLRFQPVFELATYAPYGVEALVRWEHPARGLIPPLEFISLAEDAGFIVPLGSWVLRNACLQAKAWLEQCDHDRLSINVNVSVTQLGDAGFVDDVTVVLGECNLPPENLILEVTEGVLMRETELTLRGLRRLKELGVGIAIDDFGTGYSSLGYLRRFPIDVIKIDKSLIDGVGEGADASAIVEAIVKMSHSLGLLTCAEGIESEAQVSELNAIGCALGQGYHYARPLEADGIVSLLRQHQVSRAHARAPLGLISLGHPRSSRRDPL